MKLFKLILTLFVSAFVIVSCQKQIADKPSATTDEEPMVATGNGAPSGAHFNLNIIGVKTPKNFNYDEYEQSNTTGKGRRIFVDLNGRTKILLKEGDFAVLDANGTDGTAAFQLPEPDAGDDGITDYSVYIRGLGKPGGSALMQSCFYDQQTSTEYCSTDQAFTVSVGAHGNDNKFTNVTNQLLYVWADVDADGDVDRTELFSDPLDTYYWYYDNSGLKIAQLRFYPNVGTTVWADPEPTN